jgi:hypothetical protein
MSADEDAARRVIEAAIGDDPRLELGPRGWCLSEHGQEAARKRPAPPLPDPDRALLFVLGEPEGRGLPFRLKGVSAVRLQGESVLAACGGDTPQGTSGERLRRAVLDTLDGALPIIHDQPGAIRALEEWLKEPLDLPISLRKLAQQRLGLPARHDLGALVAKLELPYRETEDPLEQADTLDACLQAMRRQGESLQELRVRQSRGGRRIDWSRFAFDREFLRHIPHSPGTYRFYDVDDNLVYVGKSKNLNQRIGSYFREGSPRNSRVQKLLDRLHRVEYDATGSDLEATLREAELIRSERPEANVQREVQPRRGRAARLESILILEPAPPPNMLNAYLIHDSRLVGRVKIGPRGGGLKRIARILDDHFFSAPSGPTPMPGPDLDVEIVVRWLAENRDSVVAFDPTDLRTTQEVVERLRWFLHQGALFDPDGSPIVSR